MGKGIKMFSAIDRYGREHTAKALQSLIDEEKTVPALFCKVHSCRCNVSFVQRHKRGTVVVSEHIRLVRNTEHADSCTYSISGRLKIIAANSSPDFLKEIDQGKIELRLHVLHESLNKSCYWSGKEMPKSKNLEKMPTEMEGSRKNLSSYLKTAADIVKLRASCEDDTALASLVLRFKDKRIPWKKFFFDLDRLDEAWETIKNSKQSYPVALVGRVKNIYSHSNNICYLNCCAEGYNPDDSGKIPSFEISMRHNDFSFFEKFDVGAKIVMLGLWQAFDAKENKGSNGKTYINHKLILFPEYKKQVAIVY